MYIPHIKTAEPFVSLFPIDDGVLGRIIESMKGGYFDEAHPLIVWEREIDHPRMKYEYILLDGHTRLEAARRVGMVDVPAVKKHFSGEDEAVEYAIRCQRDRRNLTDADLLRWVGEMKRRRRGGDQSNPPNGGMVAGAMAETLGVSARTIERTKTVIDHADDQTKAAVLAGEKSINQAYNETQAKCGEPKKCKCGVLITKKGARVCRFCSGEVKLAAGPGRQAKEYTEAREKDNARNDCGIDEHRAAGHGAVAGSEKDEGATDPVREAGGDERVDQDGRNGEGATGEGRPEQAAPAQPDETDEPRACEDPGSGKGADESADESQLDMDSGAATESDNIEDAGVQTETETGDDVGHLDGMDNLGEVSGSADKPLGDDLGGSRPGAFHANQEIGVPRWTPEFRAALEGMAAVVREMKRGGWRRMSREQAETAVRGLIELIRI